MAGKPKRDAAGLTPKHREFILHYLGAANRNGTDAAILTGYGKSSRGQARRYASEILGRPEVIAEVERLTEERAAKLGVDAEFVLRELLILKTDIELTGKSAPALRTRLDVLKTIGDHVAVGAFRRQVGLSSPSGGPIETIDAEWLVNATDEELEELERARSIIDRRAGRVSAVPDGGGDQGGEGTPPESA